MAKQQALAATHAATLRKQTFDDTHPGPLLRDFRTLLDHIPSEGLPSAGKYHLLPLTSIPVLDALLTRPLRLTLERPQLRSHPYLQGLYLLARTVGLLRVDGAGTKAKIVLHAPTRTAWDALTPCEQYCTLLEAWLVHSRGETVGGDSRGYWLQLLLEAVTAAGRQSAAWVDMDDTPRLVALADLFGLLEVEQPAQAGAKWQPVTLEQRPCGAALGRLLQPHVWEIQQAAHRLTDKGDSGQYGDLQALLRPYLPGYQQVFAIPPAVGGQAGVYVYKVSVGKVWRVLALRHDHTLHDLLLTILRAFRFSSDHLYEFRYPNAVGHTVRAGHPYLEAVPSAEAVTLDQVLTEPKQTMDLTYDFGDNWRFKVRLERIEPVGTHKKFPQVLEQRGTAPQQYPVDEE